MINVSSAWVEQMIARGKREEAAGRLGEAQGVYEEVLKVVPGNVEVMHLLGVVLFGKGEKERAVGLFGKVAELAPGLADGWNSLGLGLQGVGRMAEAEAALRRAVGLNPGNGVMWSNLGIALKGQGKLGEAIGCYREAVRLMPGLANGHNNLGNALRASGDLEGAVGAFREAVRLNAGYAEAWSNLGTALGELGRGEEAVSASGEAIRLRPEGADFHGNLGVQLQSMGRVDEAMEACRVAVELGSSYAAAHLTLAALLMARGRKEDGCEVLRRAMEKFPGVDELGFELERMSGEKDIRKLPAAMIRALFENYAPMFEDHLVKRLEYRGPELLMEGILAVGAGEGRFDILDLGCGTGLCGVLFKPLAKRMVGVDLAAGMVSRAAARGVYDEVLQGELAGTMVARKGEFDLLLAGDVFEYVGDLEEVFAAANVALRERGLFAFTVEKSDQTEMVLQSTRRFAHSLSYVRTESERHGFEELYVEERVLRMEHQKPLGAWVVVLRKGG